MRALLLAGGGFRGAFQIPILEHLAAWNKYDCVYGNSVGAINGALFAQHDLHLLRIIWSSIHNKSSFMQLTWWWPFNGLYTLKPLRTWIQNTTSLDKLKIPLAIGTVSLTDGQYHLVKTCDLHPQNHTALHRLIEASAAIPGIIKPVPLVLNGVQHLASDGGLRNAIPIPPPGDYESIDIILCEQIFKNKLPIYTNNLLSHRKRDIEILENELLIRDIEEIRRRTNNTRINIYSPGANPGGYLDASQKTIQYRFSLGEEAIQHPIHF